MGMEVLLMNCFLFFRQRRVGDGLVLDAGNRMHHLNQQRFVCGNRHVIGWGRAFYSGYRRRILSHYRRSSHRCQRNLSGPSRQDSHFPGTAENHRATDAHGKLTQPALLLQSELFAAHPTSVNILQDTVAFRAGGFVATGRIFPPEVQP